MQSNLTREEALREYYCCQDRIAQFDHQLIAIKSLGVTAAGALLATGISQGKDGIFIYLLTFFASFVFWYIEAQRKSFQMIVMTHAQHL
jgi:hypothetical protein